MGYVTQHSLVTPFRYLHDCQIIPNLRPTKDKDVRKACQVFTYYYI